MNLLIGLGMRVGVLWDARDQVSGFYSKLLLTKYLVVDNRKLWYEKKSQSVKQAVDYKLEEKIIINGKTIFLLKSSR